VISRLQLRVALGCGGVSHRAAQVGQIRFETVGDAQVFGLEQESVIPDQVELFDRPVIRCKTNCTARQTDVVVIGLNDGPAGHRPSGGASQIRVETRVPRGEC